MKRKRSKELRPELADKLVWKSLTRHPRPERAQIEVGYCRDKRGWVSRMIFIPTTTGPRAEAILDLLPSRTVRNAEGTGFFGRFGLRLGFEGEGSPKLVTDKRLLKAFLHVAYRVADQEGISLFMEESS